MKKTKKNKFILDANGSVKSPGNKIKTTGKKTEPKNGNFAFIAPSGRAIPETSASKPLPPKERTTVDDAAWDKLVMGLMEEYDEAWTQLADS
jgi:hypothetical protein